MVIPNFVEQALQGKDITVYGDGEQTRSFCHVKDVVSALVDLMNCPEAVGKVVNVGNDEEISINHLALRVKAVTGSSSQIVHVPYDKAYTEGFEDMIRRVPDITLAKKLIGFKLKYGLDDILKSVISVLRK
jgi:UDP-glucose 4-epimerase